jgi:glycosyltransferase involved in cell wall biosynthesis
MKVAFVPSSTEYLGLDSINAVDRRRLAALEPFWRMQGIDLFPWKPGAACDLVYLVNAQVSLEIAERILSTEHDRHAVVVGIIEDVGMNAWASLADEAIDDIAALTDAYIKRRSSLKGRVRELRNFLAILGLVNSKPERLHRVLAQADSVLCTSELQSAGLYHVNPFVTGVADCIPDSDYLIRNQDKAQELLRIKQEYGTVFLVWEGTAWGLQLLELIRRPLEQLATRTGSPPIMLVFLAPSKRPTKLFGSIDNCEILRHRFEIPSCQFDWSLDTIGALIDACDIGIAPMPIHNPFYRAKAFSKPLVYMKLGLPVVAAGIPSYIELIRDGQDGFIAHNDEEWLKKLADLVDNAELRTRIGTAGQLRAVTYHSVEKVAKIFANVFQQARVIWDVRRKSRGYTRCW